MNRSSTSARPLNWLYNGVQAVLGRGGQIAWEKVSSFYTKGKFTVKLNGAVAKGATSITVDALEHELAKETVLDFGEEKSVTVTFSAASVDATTVGVSALSGPIPSGAILYTGDAKEFVRLTADAAAGATSLTIEALDNALEGGETATYQGGRKLVKLTEDGSVGETALTTETIQFAIADDAEAIADYTGTGDKKFIPSGTFMARDTDDKLFPRHDVTGAETASEILASDAHEGDLKDAKSGFGTYIEAQCYENLLPDADATTGDIPSAYKTEAAANGARFTYADWSDDRADES